MQKYVSRIVHYSGRKIFPQRTRTLPYSLSFKCSTYSPWRKTTPNETNWNKRTNKQSPTIFRMQYPMQYRFFLPPEDFKNKKLTAPYSLLGRFSWYFFQYSLSEHCKLEFLVTYDKWVAWASEVRTSSIKDYNYCYNEPSP